MAEPDPEPPAPFAAPTPAVATPLAQPANSRWFLLPGFAILVGCLYLGEAIRTRLGLIIPGNILGLFLLLILLVTGVVPLRWVEGVARLLLWLLPLLFVPIFVLALDDAAFWSAHGPFLFAVMFVAMVLLWAVTGHLAQVFLRRAKS